MVLKETTMYTVLVLDRVDARKEKHPRWIEKRIGSRMDTHYQKLYRIFAGFAAVKTKKGKKHKFFKHRKVYGRRVLLSSINDLRDSFRKAQP